MYPHNKEISDSGKWNNFQVFTSFFLAFALSVFSIYWNYKSVRNEHGAEVLNYWPLIKVPVTGMLLTYLIALSFVQKHKLDVNNTREYDFSSGVIGFLFGAMPVISLLLYPGLDQLHLTSDTPALGMFLAFNTTQTFLLYRELQRGLGYKFDLTALFIGVAINVAIILVSPYTHYFMGGSGRYEVDIQGE